MIDAPLAANDAERGRVFHDRGQDRSHDDLGDGIGGTDDQRSALRGRIERDRADELGTDADNLFGKAHGRAALWSESNAPRTPHEE